MVPPLDQLQAAFKGESNAGAKYLTSARKEASVRLFRLAVILCVLVSKIAMANGCYFPEVAYPVLPSIPSQQAVIIHKDAQETLIVESSYQTQSASVGWVLPLPAEPTKIHKAEPGIVTAASFAIRPVIVHDDGGWTGIALVVAIIIAPAALVSVVATGSKRRRPILQALGICTSLSMLFLCCLVIPQFTNASGSINSLGSATELSRQQVGSYEVTVLQATSADGLTQWLTSQNLQPLSEAARKIVDGYIARHWCFAVARLAALPGQLATPHPLSLTFPAAIPVFPMQLTSLAGSQTHVELVIVADGSAVADGFHQVASDRFTGAVLSPPFATYTSATTDLAIGSPDLTPMLWNGCIVSKLTADLAPSEMDHDIQIALKPLAPHRETLFTAKSRFQIARAIAAWGLPVLLVLIGWFWRARRRPAFGAQVAVCAVAVVFVLGALVTRAALPETSARIVGGRTMTGSGRGVYMAVVQWLYEQADREKLLSSPDSVTLVAQQLAQSPLPWTNPYTGERMQWERSPGNMAVMPGDGGKGLYTFDADGRPFPILQPYVKPVK